MKKRILTFFPYYTIWKFNVQEKSINNTLIDLGYEVDTLVCDQFMESSCITSKMQPERFKNFRTQSDICRDCIKKRKYLQNKKIKTIEIKNKINVHSINILNKLKNKSLVNFKYKNFNIGKICATDLILEKKINSNLFDTKTLSELRKKILICLNLLDTLDKIDTDKYKAVFSTNGMYSVCRLFQLYFEKKKTKAYSVLSSINFNIDDHEVHVFNNDIRYFEFLKSNWAKIKNYTISNEAILRVSGYLKMLSLSLHSHTFSLGKTKINIRKFYNIEPKKKIILVTLSSRDELLASLSLNLYGNIKEDRIFKNQILWIKFLMKKFKDKKDLFFILRIHPREYKNFKSHNFHDLMKLKKNIPKNFAFDEPSNKISLYDYMKEINLVLNAWSSAVSEFGCRGVPTISYSRFSRFPLSIDYTFKNKLDYLKKINLAVNEKSERKSEERKIKFFKYIAYLSYYCSIDLKITKIFNVIFSNKFIYILKKIYLSIILKNLSFLFKKKAVVSDIDAKYLKILVDSNLDNFFFDKIKNDNLLMKVKEKKIILEELRKIYKC